MALSDGSNAAAHLSRRALEDFAAALASEAP
jgi:hypothetical protein